MIAPAPAIRVIERLETVTVFGLRLRDSLTGEGAGAEIRATLRPEQGDRPGPARAAFVTGGGVHAFRALPGLGAFERAEPEATEASPVPRAPFVLEIRDPLNRYLPVALRVALPLPYRGLFPRAPGEPADASGGDRAFDLFSAPGRTVAQWHALVQGRIVLPDGEPAAHAGVEIDLGDGLLQQGFADADGRFALPFPYPPVPADPAASPPAPLALADVEWPYALRVHHDPALLDPIPGTGLPDFLGMLEQFLGPAAGVYALAPAEGGVPLPFLPGALRRGRDEIARSAGLSSLVIMPIAGSP